MPERLPSRRERRRRRRELEAAMRELDLLDSRDGLGTMPGELPPPGRRRTSSPALAGLLVTAALLSGVVVLAPGDEFATVRRLVGLAPDRYGNPPDYSPGEGTFAFLATQPGSDEPVGYDPCRPVPYVVNPAGAPPDWEELVADGIEHTEWATGLEFRDAGTTEERPFDPARPGAGVGRSAQPVVIGFADAKELKQLAGDVAGIGGSVATRGPLGRDYYVTGSIALDTDVFDGPSSGEERIQLQAIVDHELGHVVGLDHVDDTGELMFESDLGRIDYGPGDLEGLARLGSIPCR